MVLQGTIDKVISVVKDEMTRVLIDSQILADIATTVRQKYKENTGLNSSGSQQLNYEVHV